MAELVTGDGGPGANLVQVAFAQDAAEGEMIRGLLEDRGHACLLQPAGINGPMLGVGLLPRSAQRVMVRPDCADATRQLLSEVLFENEQEAPEIANAGHLEDAKGRKPRDYGLFGAYARAWIWSLGAMGLVFAVFLLLRAT
jgi:hypothetical protein